MCIRQKVLINILLKQHFSHWNPVWFLKGEPPSKKKKSLLPQIWHLQGLINHFPIKPASPPCFIDCNHSFFFNLVYLFIYLGAPGLSCGMWDLVPWPGIKPGLPALGLRSLSHWITWEVLEGKYWVGQKVRLDFSIRCYGKYYYFYYNTILLLLYNYYHHFSGEKSMSQKVMKLAA